MSVSQLAPKYGFSDVGLAKICEKLKIPRPERGYWAKVQAGKAMGVREPSESWTPRSRRWRNVDLRWFSGKRNVKVRSGKPESRYSGRVLGSVSASAISKSETKERTLIQELS